MKRVLVAGVGNIFRGDDAFGVEVVRRLHGRSIPNTVRVVDFATRGHDLAYAILDGYDGVIFVDAARRGSPPGTLYALELSPEPAGRSAACGGHGVNLPAVFDLVRTMNGSFPRL